MEASDQQDPTMEARTVLARTGGFERRLGLVLWAALLLVLRWVGAS